MLHVIAAALPDDPAHWYQRLWAEMWQPDLLHFKKHANPVAHLTLVIVETENGAAVEQAVEQFAATASPFPLTTTGLGIFTGEEPALFVGVVSTSALADFQAAMWDTIHRLPGVTDARYLPSEWMPHLTLGWGATPDSLPAAVEHLAGRDLTFELALKDLTILRDGHMPHCYQLGC